LLVLASTVLLLLLPGERRNDAPGPSTDNVAVSEQPHTVADASSPAESLDETRKRLLAPEPIPDEPAPEKPKPPDITPQPATKPLAVVPPKRTPQPPRRLKRFVIWKGELIDGPPGMGKDYYVTGTAFSPDRRTLAVTYGRAPYGAAADNDKNDGWGKNHIALWDVEKEAEARRLKPATPVYLPYGPAFSSDGRRLLTLSGRHMKPLNFFDGADASLRVWDAASGAELACRQSTGRFLETVEAKARLSCAAFTPDGRQVVTARDFHGNPAGGLPGYLMPPGKFRDDLLNPERFALGIWNADLEGEPRRLSGHTAPAVAFAFSPDGKHVFSASGSPLLGASLISLRYAGLAKLESWDESSVRQWDLATGREVRRFPGHDRAICLAVSPDGKRLLTGGDGGQVRYWDITSGALIRQFKPPSWPTNFAFSADGRRVLIGALEHVLLYDVETGRELARLRVCRQHGDFPGLTNVAFSADGRRALIVILDDKEHEVIVEEWALGDLAPGKSPDQPDIALSPNPSPEKVPTVPAMPMPEKTQTVPPSPSSISPKPDAPKEPRRLKRLVIWKYTNAIPQDEQPYLSGTAFSSDRHTLAATYSVSPLASFGAERLRQMSAPNRVTLWDLVAGEELRPLKFASPIDHPHAPAFSPDGARLLTVSGRQLQSNGANGFEASVRLWDAKTGAEQAGQVSGSFGKPDALGRDYPIKPVKLACAGFSPDGRHVLTASDDGDLGRESVGLLRVYRSPGQPIARADYSVRMWDARLKREVRRLTGHTAPVHALAFSPDGKHVFSASGWPGGKNPIRTLPDDSSLRQWSLATGREVRRFAGSMGAFRCLTVSPDGGRLLSGSSDKRVRCWNVKTARVLHDFGGRPMQADNLAFSPDGRLALLAGTDCPDDRETGFDSVRLCDAESGAELLNLRKCQRYGSAPTITNATFSPDGRRVLLVACDREPFEVVVEEWELPQSVLKRKRE